MPLSHFLPFRLLVQIVAVFAAMLSSGYASYPLTEEEMSRLETYLPRTYPKLQAREPVHIVAIGDSVTRNLTYNEHLEDSHYAYHGVFAAELAREFFYTGGVRDVQPTKKNPAKQSLSKGPEMTLENLGMNGRLSINALGRLSTDAFVYNTDLVVINFGINDALRRLSLDTYMRSLQESIDIIRKQGRDVILCGPSIIRMPDSLDGVGSSITYAGAMKTVADRNAVLFVDFNDVTASAPGIPLKMSDADAKNLILEAHKQNFNHGADIDDLLHPAFEGHQKMGLLIHKTLMGHADPPSYRLGGVFTIDRDGAGVLEFKLKNLTESQRRGRLFLPMTIHGLTPESATMHFDIKPEKGQVFQVRYSMSSSGSEQAPALRFDGNEVIERFPILICDEEATVPGLVEAAVFPVTAVWNLGSSDGNKGNFTVEATLENSSSEASSGSYEAQWNGQRVAGTFQLPAGGKQAVSFPFDLPRTDQVRVFDKLRLMIKTGSTSYVLDRDVEVTKNTAIGDEVPLLRADRYRGQEAQDPGAGEVSMIPMADKKGLYLTFIAKGCEMIDTEKASALNVEIYIDARGYGERRTFGFIDFLRFLIRSDNNEVKVAGYRPGIFGNGYDRKLEMEKIKVSRKQLPGGEVQVVIMIPRSFFYLHEWALGNGNSQLGLHATVRMLKVEPKIPDGYYPPSRQFSNSDSGMEPHNAESLPILELDIKSTGRWSVRVH